ncbi:hypothetical protein [Streptomyces sp. NPDC001889]
MEITLDLKATSTDGRYRISTVGMGAPMPCGRRFETMVFDTEIDDEVDSRRYTTPEEATRGHDATVLEVNLIEEALRP